MTGRSVLAVVCVFSALVGGLVAATGVPEDEAQTAAESWLALVDGGSYAESWERAASVFKTAVKKDDWSRAVTGARGPLGKVVSRKLKSRKYTEKLPGAPDGNYVVMQFDSSFANKKNAVETVTFMQEKDGKWKAAGYYIK